METMETRAAIQPSSSQSNLLGNPAEAHHRWDPERVGSFSHRSRVQLCTLPLSRDTHEPVISAAWSVWGEIERHVVLASVPGCQEKLFPGRESGDMNVSARTFHLQN